MKLYYNLCDDITIRDVSTNIHYLLKLIQYSIVTD